MQNRGRGEGVRSLLLSPLHAPRGTSIPSALSRFHILPGTTGVYVPRQHPYSRLRRLCVSVSLWQIPCSHKLTASLSSLCLFSALPSFVFKSLQPLFAKHPGCGVAATFLGRPSLRHSPLSGRLQRLFGLQYTLRPGSWQHRRIYTPHG